MSDRSRWLIAIAALAVLACSDKTGPPGLPVTFQILSARVLEDTIRFLYPEPLTIAVLDAEGRRVPGGLVGITVHTDGVFGLSTVLVGPDPDHLESVSSYLASANVEGLAHVYLRNGLRAGRFPVYLSIGNVRDSVDITIRPGAPVGFNFSPEDTAMYVDATYGLTYRAHDIGENTTPDTVTFTPRRPEVATADANGVVHAHATGRAFIVVASGNARDSIAISVVPDGTLLAFRHAIGSGEPARFFLFNLDGSEYRLLREEALGFGSPAQFFMPDGNRIVYHETVELVGVHLMTMDLAGAVDTLLKPSDSIPGPLMPQPSRDGAWIYFTSVVGAEEAEIWRMDTAGTVVHRVGPAAMSRDQYYAASPSPDGSRLAVLLTRVDKSHLVIVDVATGQATTIRDSALGRPRWSPTADEVAHFHDNGFSLILNSLLVIGSDGQQLLEVPASSPFGWDVGNGQVDWSPDGRWLVACHKGAFSGARGLSVIDRQTGEVLPLPFTDRDNLCGATWRP